MRKICKTLLLILSISFLNQGCNKQDDSVIDKNNVTFQGTIIPATTTKATEADKQYHIEIIYNKAITMENLKESMEHKTITPDANGNFNFQIEKGKKFIAFLVDATQTYRKAIGVIGIGTGENQYWENIDTQYTDGIINLGKIMDQPINQVLSTEYSIDQMGITGANQELVRQLSQLDNHVRLYKNCINANYENLTGPAFTYLYNDITYNTWITQQQVSYAGYQIYLWGKNLGDQLSILPVSQVQTGEGTSYSSQNPITGVKVPIEDPAFSVYNFITGESTRQLLKENPPQGYWTLNLNGEKSKEFDYGCVLPLKNNEIVIPIPLLKINSQNNVISTMEVKWVLRDPSGIYTPIDNQILKTIVPSFMLEIADHSGEDPIKEEKTISLETSSITLDQSWNTQTATTGQEAQYIGLTYIIDGVFHRFVLSQSNE